MQRVAAIVERIAAADVPVLISARPAPARALVARAIHAGGPRGAARFVAVNCAALPDPLLESELFGHVSGAFTGATSDAPGLFVEAHGGTLLLDEIGEMSPQLQAKLLHVLESGTVRPLGCGQGARGRRPASSPRRIAICARASPSGSFREDLLYRLEVVAIELPPLRHARGRSPRRCSRIFSTTRAASTRHRASAASRARRSARLLDYRWPGNVRELAHAVERAALLAEGRSWSSTIFRRTCRAAAGGGAVRGRCRAVPRAAAALRALGARAARRAQGAHRRGARRRRRRR